MQERRQFWAKNVEMVTRSSLGHRSVVGRLGMRQRMGGYKPGQETHKTTQNGQKVMMAVIYINLPHSHINFSLSIRQYISNLRKANINRRIWI